MSFIALAPLTGIDKRKSDDLGDELTIKPRDCARFQRMACQLRLSIDMERSESHFGCLSDDHPYGDNIWQGMLRQSKKKR